ncbi:MAG TPA: PAS domain S-box protein [Burkholderiales bacterium]|nr:PAS domain S-box protein [Burkholderiales bacterium]
MAVTERIRPNATRPEVAPALFRLLAEASLSRAALDACGTPMALADAASASRSLSYVNQAFEAFFGYRAAEALGRPAATLLLREPQDAESLFREPAAPRTLRARRKDGSEVHVEVSVGVIRASDGIVTHWVLSFADCSELELLRDRLNALRAAG